MIRSNALHFIQDNNNSDLRWSRNSNEPCVITWSRLHCLTERQILTCYILGTRMYTKSNQNTSSGSLTISERSSLSLTEITPSESSGGRLVFIGVTIGVLLAIIAIVAFVMSRWVLATHHHVHTSLHLCGDLDIFQESMKEFNRIKTSSCWESFLLSHLYFQETKVIQTAVVCPHRDSWYSALRTRKDEDLLMH